MWLKSDSKKLVPNNRYANPYKREAIKTSWKWSFAPTQASKANSTVLHQGTRCALLNQPPLEAGFLPTWTFHPRKFVLAALPLEFTGPTSPDMTHAGHAAASFPLDVIQRH